MQLIAGRYELLRLLGEGGMARVHVARDQVLDRRVALKLLRSDIGRDEVLRERFLREAKLAARLTHENIVRVYDTGIDTDDTPWMAMELVEGSSLREEMTAVGQLEVSRAVTVINQVLGALAAAHDAGIIHRDVKPANVLLNNGRAQLSDFGIAKSVQGGADLTQTNQFLGTPKYTAPEVAMGFPATPKSDVYSAAVVLWEMLAGTPPFEHDNALALAMMHRTDDLPSLGELREDLTASFIAAIEAGLAKEPADRPDNATGFAALLQAGLKGDPAALAAATAPTAAIPRISIPQVDPNPAAGLVSQDPREATLAIPHQDGIAPQPPAPAMTGITATTESGTPRPPAHKRPKQRRSAPGLIILVLLLLIAAVLAFNAFTSAGDVDPEATPSATPTASPSESEATPTPTPTPSASTAPEQPGTATEPNQPAPTEVAPTPPPPNPTAEPEPAQPSEPAVDPVPDPTVEPAPANTPEPVEPPVGTPEPVTAPG